MSRNAAGWTRGAVRGVLAAMAALLVAAGPATAQDSSLTVRGRRALSSEVQQLDVEIRYAAGRLDVGPAAQGELYSYSITYDEDVFRPLNEWTLEDGTGRLRVGIRKAEPGEGEGKSWWRRLLTLDFDFGFNFDDFDEEDGVLALRLSPERPTSLDIEVGAAESRLALGGMSLSGLDISTGATDTEITFDRPNRTEMKELRLEAGAASFRASGLGNARFRELSFRGGVGDVRLDFTGEWSRDAEASVEMAMGSLRLVFPADLGVRIHREGFLASVDAPGFVNTEGGGLESQNWSEAEHRLELSVRTALGSVEVDRVQ